MTKLIITRGYPGSGKTTYARSWVAGDDLNRARVNRDDLRFSMFDTYVGLTYPQEQAVTKAQHAMVEALLRSGKSVVVDDTNLRAAYATKFADMAHRLGVAFEVVNIETPAEECIARDISRGERGARSVGPDVIRSFASRFPIGQWREIQPHADAPKLLPYVPNRDLPPCIIVDIDGTIAERADGPDRRSPYDWARVGEDNPVDVILGLIGLMWIGVDAVGNELEVVFMSGRDEVCRKQTGDWLATHCPLTGPLFMRPEGDTRKDSVVKAELFDQYVRENYNVLAVFDDRQQVVDMWREMGLTCLQVAPGDF